MTEKSIKNFIKEIYSKPQKKFATDKTNVYYFHDIWSVDILDLKGYGPEKNRGYRYVLVILDNFSKFGWTFPLKKKTAITKTNAFENILISPKRKPILIETDRDK